MTDKEEELLKRILNQGKKIKENDFKVILSLKIKVITRAVA